MKLCIDCRYYRQPYWRESKVIDIILSFFAFVTIWAAFGFASFPPARNGE